MKTELLQQATVLTKEATEIALFSFFTSRSLFESFDSSAGPMVLLPIIAVSFIANATFDWIQFAQQKEKSPEQMTRAIVSTASAALVTTAVIGKLAAGAAFAAGPYLFVAAMSLGILMNMISVITNIVKALEAPKDSPERAEFAKAAFKNAMSMLAIGFVMGAIIVTLISPVGPAVMLGMAMLAVAFTSINFALNLSSMQKSILDTKADEKSTIELSKSPKKSPRFFDKGQQSANDVETQKDNAPLLKKG